MAKTIAHIALGSNLGDRGETLLNAARLLDVTDGIRVLKISQFITTEPVGGPDDQEKYLNGAATVETDLSPRELLSTLATIEHACGRRRKTEPRWGPRTCDLDILLIGDTVIQTEELTIPHPRMHQRLFVLRPLASIAPDAVHPVLGKTVVDMLIDAEVGK